MVKIIKSANRRQMSIAPNIKVTIIGGGDGYFPEGVNGGGGGEGVN